MKSVKIAVLNILNISYRKFMWIKIGDSSYCVRINDGIQSFLKCEPITDMQDIIQMTIQGKKQQEIDRHINHLALVRWSKNNIIRCWNTEQKRFADGFDF